MHESPWPSENPAPAGRHFARKASIDWQLLIIVVGVVGVVLAACTGVVFVTEALMAWVGEIGTALTGALAR